MVYAHQGEYAKALEWSQKALDIHEKVLGSNHPKTKAVFNNTKTAYQKSGNPKPFEEWLTETM
jgi:lipopolysaccharide biosynthesis regulator YciM